MSRFSSKNSEVPTETYANRNMHAPRLASTRWLVVALILFLLQVVPLLSYRWVTDESWYAATAVSLIHGGGMRNLAMGPNELQSHFDARPPGTQLVIAGAFRTFGIGAWQARTGFVLAGLLTVFMTFMVARNLWGPDVAVMVALLLCTDNVLVLVSRSARPEALTAMFAAVSLLAVERYAARNTFSWWATWAGILAAVGVICHVELLGWVLSLGFIVLWIDWRARRFAFPGAWTYSAGFLVGMSPFALWLATAPLGNIGLHAEYLNRGPSVTLRQKFFEEGHRYGEMLGFNALHGHGLEQLPMRLPIPVCFLVASYLLWRYARRWFYAELVLLVPTALWFIYTINKTSRYLADLSPFVALAFGAALFAVRDRSRLRRTLAGAICGIVLLQAAANFWLLWSARRANYTKLASEFQAVLPPQAMVYGTITFWLALRDHPYISYERTTPAMARQFGARYFIVGDRMMQIGDPRDDFYGKLQQGLDRTLADATLVKEIDDPYYGDLRVFRVDNSPR